MAIDFDGTDDYIEAALGANYDVPKTLSCWFNADSATTAYTLLSLSNGSTAENLSPALAIRLTTGSAVLASTSAGNGISNAITATTFTQGNWHHAAAVFPSSASRTIYLDGAGTVGTATRATGGALDNLIIGQGSGGTYNPAGTFNGRLAEVAVWDVALSSEEITALAKGYKPSLIQPNKLLWYLPLVRTVQDIHSRLTYTNQTTGVANHVRRIG